MRLPRAVAAALALLPALAAWMAGCATPGTSGASTSEHQPATWPVHVLGAAQVWFLGAPGAFPFEASALLRTPDGGFLTLSDKVPQIYRVRSRATGDVADLQPQPALFPAAPLGKFAREKRGPWDCEGLAQDEQGRLYVCEEGNRWILRSDPRTGAIERLAIDWSPVAQFFSADRNASFEGVAVGDGKLYVANERSKAVIIVVDLARLQVEDWIVVTPRTGSFLGLLHYSDLAWFDHRLWVLCRHHRVVLEVEPATHAVRAEFNYRAAEDALDYPAPYGTGVMEGLAVAAGRLWLVTDNNGEPRRGHPGDRRPALLEFPAPIAAAHPVARAGR